jgi:hypothetical protein
MSGSSVHARSNSAISKAAAPGRNAATATIATHNPNASHRCPRALFTRAL